MELKQADAERICEWLGLEKKICEFADHGSYRNGKQGINFRKATAYITTKSPVEMGTEDCHLLEWLSSNAGTVAMIEKLLSTGCLSIDLPDKGDIYYGKLGNKWKVGNSLNEVLQVIILELIGGK